MPSYLYIALGFYHQNARSAPPVLKIEPHLRLVKELH
jgi:hypothetical protein